MHDVRSCPFIVAILRHAAPLRIRELEATRWNESAERHTAFVFYYCRFDKAQDIFEISNRCSNGKGAVFGFTALAPTENLIHRILQQEHTFPFEPCIPHEPANRGAALVLSEAGSADVNGR